MSPIDSRILLGELLHVVEIMEVTDSGTALSPILLREHENVSFLQGHVPGTWYSSALLERRLARKCLSEYIEGSQSFT